MLLAKLKIVSEYESFHCSAMSIVSCPPPGRSRSPFDRDRLIVQHVLAAVQVLDELDDAAARNETRCVFTGSVRSSLSVILRPLFRNAISRSRCARVSKLNFVTSMMVRRA